MAKNINMPGPTPEAVDSALEAEIDVLAREIRQEMDMGSSAAETVAHLKIQEKNDPDRFRKIIEGLHAEGIAGLESFLGEKAAEREAVRERRGKRTFLNKYEVFKDRDGAYKIVDAFTDENDPEKKEQPYWRTQVRIPDPVAGSFQDDEHVRDELIDKANAFRAAIKGMTIHFDPSKEDPDVMHPKWVYQFAGKREPAEQITTDVFTDQKEKDEFEMIMRLVKEKFRNREYKEDAAYDKWFNRMKHRKRAEIVSRKLADEYPSEKAEEPGEEVEDSPSEAPPKEKTLTRERIEADTKNMIANLSKLYTLPENLRVFYDNVLKLNEINAGFPKGEAREAMIAAVEDAFKDHFKKNSKISEELERIFQHY